jgi:hypothetical protein
MTARNLPIAILALALAPVSLVPAGGGPGSFDRLNDTDRQMLQARFEREVWPLLLRDGKDGCVGCHVANHRSTLKFVGKPDEDFRKLLKDGFFLHNDSANLVALTETKDRKKRMPPGQRPAWPADDIKLLKQFIADVDKKQKR